VACIVLEWGGVNFRPLWMLLVFLLLGEGARADIPFEFHDGLVWVKVETPGRSFHFVLDSGAGSSLLNLQTAAALGLKMGRAVSVLGVGSRDGARYVEGFEGKLCDVPLGSSMLVMDLSVPSRACGRTIDGLIGADFFRGRIVEIDFKKRLIRLVEHSEADAPGSLRIIDRNGAFCVPIEVNGGKPAWVRLDTGCNTALQFVIDRHGAAGCAGAGEVRLGAERLDGVKIGLHQREIFPGESGLLGTGILSKFKVTIDLKANRLLLASAS